MLIISYSLNSNTSYLFDNADNNADYYDYVVNTDNIKAKMNMTNSTVNVAWTKTGITPSILGV